MWHGGRFSLCRSFWMLTVMLGASAATTAEVLFDGTVGPTGQMSGDMEIGAQWGTQVGQNLFHSFEVFNVAQDESLTFSGPDDVARVVGRVTGGLMSTIEGALGSTIPNVSIYLFNPSGFAVGPNAQIDVPNGFYLSSAGVLQFSDGIDYEAVPSAPAQLSIAEPTAFGFLDEPGALTVHGQIQAQRISLVGGAIDLRSPTLYAPGGRVDLVAASDGLVVLGDGPPLLQQSGPGAAISLSLESLADLRVVDGRLRANVDTSNPPDGPNGPVYIRGQQFTMDGGFIFADAYGDGADVGVDLAVSGDALLMEGARLTSDRLGGGDTVGSDLRLQVGGELRLEGAGTGISSRALGGAPAGSLQIEAGAVMLADNATLSTSSSGSGRAGDVALRAANVTITQGGRVSAATSGSGVGGSVLIEADAVRIEGQSADTAADAGIDVVSTGRGTAGQVTIESRSIDINDGGSIIATTFADVSSAVGGTILLSADAIRVSGGRIEARTVSPAGGGDIRLIARERLQAGEGFSISAATDGPGGAGGTVFLAGPAIELASGSIVTSSDGVGAGGSIELAADMLSVTGTDILATSRSTLSDAGAAGRVRIEVDEARINAARIATSTAGGNQATPTGGVRIVATDQLIVADGAELASSTRGAARGGVVELAAGALSIAGASISTSAQGAGDSGEISLTAVSLLLDDAEVTTDAAISTGGSVALAVDGTAVLRDAQVRASAGADGAGGDLDVAADLLVLERSALLARADAGNGGQIDLAARGIVQDFEGVISADSNTGTAGTVDILAPDSDVAAAVQSQRTEFESSRELVRDRCAARGSSGSSLVIEAAPTSRMPEELYGGRSDQRPGCGGEAR